MRLIFKDFKMISLKFEAEQAQEATEKRATPQRMGRWKKRAQ
ncbi:MAG: hypothetical protein RR729_02810 [Comamonas sp.]